MTSRSRRCVKIAEAKARLSELIERVARGEEIVIRRVPVCRPRDEAAVSGRVSIDIAPVNADSFRKGIPMAQDESSGTTRTPVQVPIDGRFLAGDLAIPASAHGLVLFAHGSGSSRHSPRNQYVARTLERRDLATLLIDLLTPQEETIDDRTAEYRFDIPMLAARLVAIVDWLRSRRETAALPIGLFGASTGGGAALIAAADRPREIAAVVSRGGRPDLAGAALPRVTVPTLLIVGGFDTPVIQMNRDAMKQMTGDVQLEIVPGATHLFEEPGTLERVAELAGVWFASHLHPVAAAPHR